MAQSSNCESNFSGRWLAPDKNSSIEIFVDENENIVGILDWMQREFEEDGSIRLDKFNPIDSLQKRPIKGIQIIYALQCKTDNELINGKVYNPNDGYTYDCTVKLNKANELVVRGYIYKPIFGKSVVYTK